MAALVLLASVAAVVTCDQATKALVARHGPGLGDDVRAVGIRPLTNARGALIRLPRQAAVVVWIAVAAGVLLSVVLGPVVSWPAMLGLGFALGGAAGNLVDRIARDGVVDFIVVGRWPVFNLADAALVAGAALCALSLL